MGGKGKGGGGYPWWQHIKSKGGGKNEGGKSSYDEPAAKRQTLQRAETELQRYAWNLEGSSYPAYKDLAGKWEEPDYTVFVDHVQGDAYAPPSMVRCRIPAANARYPADYATDKTKNRAVCDFLQRSLNDLLRGGSGTDWTVTAPKGGWSSSKGGDIQPHELPVETRQLLLQIDCPSQFVLQRSGVVLTSTFVEARVTLALPAQGRTCEGRKAAGAFAALVEACQKALVFGSYLDKTKLDTHIKVIEDQVYLRGMLPDLGLVAFVGNGAILPRASGADDRPMQSKAGQPPVVAFQSPVSLEVEVQLPHAGAVRGMGVTKGVTLIVGGGFHGKSTLLQGLQTGIYDAVPGDGREFVVADENAFKVRAEDGRPVTCTDISPFIKNLPFSLDTTKFSTKDASGSTSQAANISEAIEAGAKVFLVDEDTCATNFMVRDAQMQMLVHKDKEPIQPFCDKVRPLFDSALGISTVLVVGGSGAFFSCADTVICMESYQPRDVTAEARAIAGGAAPPMQIDEFPILRSRSLNLQTGLAAEGKASARNLRCIQYGEQEVELTYVEQLVELSQAKALCDTLQLLAKAEGQFRSADNFRELLDKVDQLLGAKMGTEGGNSGLDALARRGCPNGFYAKPRKLEVAACVNRLRTAVFS